MTVVTPLFPWPHAALTTSVSHCPYVQPFYTSETRYMGVCPSCGFCSEPGTRFQAANRIARHIYNAKRREARA